MRWIDMDPDDAAFHPPACTCCRCEAREPIDRESNAAEPRRIDFDRVEEDDGEPQ